MPFHCVNSEVTSPKWAKRKIGKDSRRKILSLTYHQSSHRDQGLHCIPHATKCVIGSGPCGKEDLLVPWSLPYEHE